MDYLLLQMLNGVQLGLLMFLLAAGLTLTFGIMDLVNLAHGSLYMMGAYIAWTLIGWTDSFVLGALLALPATFLLGVVVEAVVMRRLYARDHLDQVLATFGLILFFNELVRAVWGPAGKSIAVPSFLARTVEILPGVPYPAYRFAIIVVGAAVAALLAWLVARTRLGMLIRAGASNRRMIGALGVNIELLFSLVFGLGAVFAGLAGLMAAPLSSVKIGMGDDILILAFVIIVIGGIGSIKGAFVAAMVVGQIDIVGRAFLPDLLKTFLSTSAASSAAPAISQVLVYIADGGRAGLAADRPVRPALMMAGVAHAARTGDRPAAAGAGRPAAADAGLRPALPAVDRHAHRHLGDRRHQPQHDPGLWRDGELRPCHVLRHRRLCRGHPGRARRRQRLDPMAGRHRWPPPCGPP